MRPARKIYRFRDISIGFRRPHRRASSGCAPGRIESQPVCACNKARRVRRTHRQKYPNRYTRNNQKHF
jgi:hypothetical protein